MNKMVWNAIALFVSEYSEGNTNAFCKEFNIDRKVVNYLTNSANVNTEKYKEYFNSFCTAVDKKESFIEYYDVAFHNKTINQIVKLVKPLVQSGSHPLETFSPLFKAVYYMDHFKVFNEDWFKEDFGNIKHYEDLTSPIIKEWLDISKNRIAEEKKEAKWRQQRAERGFSDCDVWAIDDWFIDIMPRMLRQLNKNRCSYPVLMENPSLEKTGSITDKEDNINDKKWGEILNHMAFLCEEMDESKCSMQNQYTDKLDEMNLAFAKKYPNRDVLKTPEELERDRTSGGILHVGPERDPDTGEEYKELLQKWISEDRKIKEYQCQCKNEFFELFSKYFYSLWD